MMKVSLAAARCRVETTWWNTGSVLRGDYETGLRSLHTDLQVESDASPAELARLILMAERGCYVLSALANPPVPTRNVSVNGEPFEPETGSDPE